MKGDLADLEDRLNYRFSKRELLLTALSHDSYGNEIGAASNERLEFLGDAVLHLIITEHIMERYPEADEGTLSFLRSCSESEDFLHRLAQKFELGNFLLLGKGEEKCGGREKKAILADAMEALIAAVCLDGGYPLAKLFVLSNIEEMIAQTYENALFSDSKSELQKIAQKYHGSLPIYTITEEKGLEHDKTFLATVAIHASSGVISAEGSGKNKKSAEKAAARNLLEMLRK